MPGHLATQHGFNLLELTMVLIVIGVLGLMTTYAFSGADNDLSQRPETELNIVREALRHFVLVNKRLPCPDFSGNDGYEGVDAATGECTNASETGFVPYVSIGLENVTHNNRMRYAVYRAGGENDITTLEERTNDTEGQPDYMGFGDMIRALEAIAAASADSGHVRVATLKGDGTSDCALWSHPAFILIVPNQDKDDSGDELDGVNAAGNKCFASPLQAQAWNYDDAVAMEPPGALIGWITRHMN
jgi:prepilin-type N-terminal cleavage/methylation domain-containing protein